MIVAVTITENESVFHFHQIVEEVVRVIVVRRIERKQLVEVGQELLCTLLVSNYRYWKIVRLKHDIEDGAHDTRNKKVRLTRNNIATQARGDAKAWSPNSRMSEVSHRLMTASRTSVIPAPFLEGVLDPMVRHPFHQGSC